MFIALIALFGSCQSGTDVTQILSNQDTKKAIMNSIADDSNLSVEMMETMMNGKMMMHKNMGGNMDMKGMNNMDVINH